MHLESPHRRHQHRALGRVSRGSALVANKHTKSNIRAASFGRLPPQLGATSTKVTYFVYNNRLKGTTLCSHVGAYVCGPPSYGYRGRASSHEDAIFSVSLASHVWT